MVICMAGLYACSNPPTPDTKVIVGATLIRESQAPLSHAVIVVKDDRIAAIGSQQMTPVPPGSSKVDAYGKFVAAAEQGNEMLVGSKANLVILSEHPAQHPTVERRMKEGRWIN